MIEKLEFYHGAALVRLIEDPRCETIGKHEFGYRVNQKRFVAIKYSTKALSPWGFTFSKDDITRLQMVEAEFGECLVAFVCGGDGICALSWTIIADLLGNSPAESLRKTRLRGVLCRKQS